MENTFGKAEELASHVKDYLNNRIDSVKLSIAEKSSEAIASFIAKAIVLIVFTFFVLFASFSLAYVLAKFVGELYWGFLIVSGIYLMIGIMVLLFKEKLLRLPIMNNMLQKLTKENDDEN